MSSIHNKIYRDNMVGEVTMYEVDGRTDDVATDMARESVQGQAAELFGQGAQVVDLFLTGREAGQDGQTVTLFWTYRVTTA